MEKKVTTLDKIKAWSVFFLFFGLMWYSVSKVIINLYHIDTLIAIMSGLVITMLAVIFQVILKKRKGKKEIEENKKKRYNNK